jgi:hypothetical protein
VCVCVCVCGVNVCVYACGVCVCVCVWCVCACYLKRRKLVCGVGDELNQKSANRQYEGSQVYD